MSKRPVQRWEAKTMYWGSLYGSLPAFWLNLDTRDDDPTYVQESAYLNRALKLPHNDSTPASIREMLTDRGSYSCWFPKSGCYSLSPDATAIARQMSNDLDKIVPRFMVVEAQQALRRARS